MKTWSNLLVIFVCLLLIGVQTIDAKTNIKSPMMGWSSWNTFRININDTLIFSVADSILSKGLFGVGYNYINIDDGFFGGRDPQGKLYCNKKFPQGLSPIVNYIHKLGLKAGIYSDAGANTCGSIFDNDTIGLGVGLWRHENKDCKLFFDEWKFDFIKVDFCGGDETGKSDKERYEDIYKHIQNSKRKNIRLNICRWQFPGTWALNIADSWRIDADINPEFKTIDRIILKNLYLGSYASPGHYNDMDMLELGRGLSADEEKTHFGIWCIMSSPLMIGCDVRSIPQSTLNLLMNKEVISINQDKLGIQAKVVSHNDSVIILAKDLKKLHSTLRCVALYNQSEKAKKVYLSFRNVLLGGKIEVKDLWNNNSFATSKDGIYVDIPGHGCALYKLKAQKRFDAVTYEAENAFLNGYSPQNILNARVEHYDNASNKMIIKNLGGDISNWCKFSDIYVSSKGKYLIRLYGFNDNAGILNVSVNDKNFDVQIAGKKQYSQFINEFKVDLRKGINELTISSNDKNAPDLDKLDIIHLK